MVASQLSEYEIGQIGAYHALGKSNREIGVLTGFSRII